LTGVNEDEADECLHRITPSIFVDRMSSAFAKDAFALDISVTFLENAIITNGPNMQPGLA
jgi:hypothetical protein